MVRDTAGAPEEAVRRVAALYSAKVTWADRWLGELLDALEATGRADDTCVLLTSDHGTSLNERGFFGKRAPIHEQEGHTPFILRLPGGERGESDIIVQPQDIFGTIAHLAGVGLPEGAHGLSVLEQAHSESGEREIALGGTAAGPWWGNSAGQPLLTVFDDTWQMHLSADPGSCRLMRLGDTADVAEANPEAVERLWRAALAELQRRGIDERLLAWLESQGEGELGEDIVYWDGYPGPAGYSAYFSRLWEEW